VPVIVARFKQKVGMCQHSELPNIKFIENPFSRSRVFSCVQTDGQNYLTGACMDANMPKNDNIKK
jgi:hypothetical protein